MPDIETACRNQRAVLWMASATAVSDDGKRKVAAAVEIKVRWENRREETTDSQGQAVSVTAEVVVDRDVIVGSILWLGALDDIASPPVNLQKVVAFDKIPDVKGTKYRRTVRLTRHHNTLPPLV